MYLVDMHLAARGAYSKCNELQRINKEFKKEEKVKQKFFCRAVMLLGVHCMP